MLPATSFPQILDKVLSNWGSFLRLLLLLLALAGLAIGTVAGVLYLPKRLGLKRTDVQFSVGSGGRIAIERFDEESGSSEYLFPVHPQGWQRTPIEIEPGAGLTIEADGRVNISLHRIVESVARRHELEERIVKSKPYLDALKRNPLITPERFFTKEERTSLMLKRPWVGPKGYPGPAGIKDGSYDGRTASKLLPAEPFGTLVAAILGGDDEPVRTDGFAGAFRVANRFETEKWQGKRGTLWLAVNDVLDDQDPDPDQNLDAARQLREKFYIDNVGFFIVKVKVKKP